MFDAIRLIFDTSDFPARWTCGRWTGLHGWVHVLSDLAIFGAYFTIPLILFYFVIKKKADIPFQGVFLLFGAFILLCGTGHLIESTLFWHPWYRLSAVVKVATALVSWGTVVALVPVVPQALALPGVVTMNARLEEANAGLQQEIRERKRAEGGLQERDELIRSLLDSTAEAIYGVDLEGKCTFANAACARMLGYGSPDDFLGYNMHELIHHTRPDGTPYSNESCRIYQAFREGRGTHVDDEVLWRRDGSSFAAEYWSHAVRRDGEIVGSVVTFLDITERKRAENLFQVAVEAAPNAMVMIDAEGRINLVNAQGEELFGYAREELLGKPIEMLVPAEIQDEHVGMREAFFANPEKRSMGAGRDLYGRRKDGTPFPVEIGLNPIKTPEGTFVLSAVVDITDRKRLETRFRATVEASLDAVVTMDGQGKVIGWNPQAETMFGWSYDEIAGQSLAETIIPPDYRDAHRDGLKRYLATGEGPVLNQRLELSALRRNGEEFPIELSISALQIAGGHQFSAFVRDLTDRKRAENLFQVAVEAAPNAMVMIDEGGGIKMVNGQAEELFGYAREELLGKPIETLVPVEIQDRHVGLRDAFFANPEKRSMGEGRDLFGRRKDGSRFPVEIGLNPVETAEGRFVLSAVVDITERKRAEAKLANYTRDLEEKNKELDEFTYVAAHDLQEPLRKLISFSALLPRDLGGDLPVNAQKDLDFMTSAAHQMRTLVRDLLAISRANRSELTRTPTRLGDCVEEAIQAIETQLEETGAAITQDALPEVDVEPRLVTQLFQNLIGNALKFQDPGRVPEVHLTVAEEGGEWVFGVKDNGIGIEPEFIEKIFAPFKRLHARTKYEGSGIGLAICQKVVHRHGGRIWVESELGQGSHFKFTLSGKDKGQWVSMSSGERSSS